MSLLASGYSPNTIRTLFTETAKYKNSFYLAVVLFIGAFLRFNNLTFQSLWGDELATMMETDPDYTLSQVLSYFNLEPHPPFYILFAHYWFKVFGYNDFSARFVSAFFGTLGVFVMFLLGRKLYNSSVGLIAGLLTALNTFHIAYSQEVRSYSLAFLFSALSFYCLIRLIKHLTVRNSVFYGLATLLLLYTHYYGFAVLGAQILLILVLFFHDQPNRTKFFLLFSLSGLIVGLLYAPWIKFVLKAHSLSSFWIPKPNTGFFAAYFSEYFSGNLILIYLFCLLIILFFVRALSERFNGRELSRLVNNKLLFSLLVVSLWISVSYLIPYIRSLINVPMLYSKYTIVTLPAVLLAVAIGFQMVGSRLFKSILIVFVVLNVYIELFLEKDFYHTTWKEQWREASAFAVKHNAFNLPVYSDVAALYKYYFKVHGSTVPVRDYEEDKILKFSGRAFWVVSGHGYNTISADMQKHLDSTYTLRKEYNGIYSWAKLYTPPDRAIPANGGAPFAPGVSVLWGNGTVESAPVRLTKGAYYLFIKGYGSKAGEVTAHANLYVNGRLIRDFLMPETMDITAIPIVIPKNMTCVFRIEFDNDYTDPATQADRNLFFEQLSIAGPML